MHALVQTYQIKPGQVEARLRHSRERNPSALRHQPGRRGVLVLVNPASHKNVVVSFWDTEADMHAFERNTELHPTLAQHQYAAGEVTTERFDVGHEELGTGRYARVRTYHVKPGEMEDRLRYQREVAMPAAKQVPGRKGVSVLVDRTSHKNLVISLWETEAEMLASERHASFQAATIHSRYAAGDVKSEIFEVARDTREL